MAFRDFDAARRERQRQTGERPPITFALGGHIFTCVPVMPLGPILSLAEIPDDVTTPEEGIEAAAALMGFLRSVIVKSDHAALDAVLADTDDPVNVEDLHGLVGWLAEEYSGRPTPPSSLSPLPADSDGRNSNQPSVLTL